MLNSVLSILCKSTQLTPQTYPEVGAFMGFPGGLDGKESACNAGDPGSISGAGRSPGEGNGKPLQYSLPENSVDREEPGRLQSMGSQKSQT